MPVPMPATGTVTGVVRHATTGSPLPDVAVVVQNVAPRVETETDARGEFLLVNVPPGAQVIVAVKDGWKAVQAPVDVRGGQNTAAPALQMTPP